MFTTVDLYSFFNISTIFITFLVIYCLHVLYSEKNMPPSPWIHRWPLVGHLPYLETDLHLQFMKLAEKYGPVFMLHVGSWRVVAVNGSEAVKEVLVTKSLDFAGRPSTPLGDILSDNGRSIVRGSYGPAVRLQRKIFISGLRQFLEKSYSEDFIVEEIQDLLKKFDETKCESFDPQEVVRDAILNIICFATFGKRFNGDEQEYFDLSRIITRFNAESSLMATLIVWIPWLKYFNPEIIQKTWKIKNILYSIYKTNLECHKITFDSENIRDFTDGIILAKKQAEEEDSTNKQYLTDTYLVNALSNVIGAGFETITTTLYWALLYLAQNPQYQITAQEELDRVIGRDRLPRIEDKPDLPFNHAIVYESLRLANTAPLALPHMTLRGTTLQGYHVPKDTMVIVNLWSVQMDPEIWSEPKVFNPYRFLDENGQVTVNYNGWLPFSAGRRVCAGEALAKTELFLFLACILQRFTLKIPNGENIDMKGLLGLTYSPIPYNLLVEPR